MSDTVKYYYIKRRGFGSDIVEDIWKAEAIGSLIVVSNETANSHVGKFATWSEVEEFAKKRMRVIEFQEWEI